MTSNSVGDGWSDEQFTKLLEELIGKIESGPGSHVDVLAQIAKQHPMIKELSKAIIELNNSLEAIRLILKYLMFDLEATCRERDKLRTMLEDQK